MTKKLLFTLAGSVVLAVLGVFLMNNTQDNSDIELLRAQHQTHLDNSPFKETKNLPKDERKALGLPPNPYFEREWELTMNPALGYPEPQKIYEIQDRLNDPSSGMTRTVPGDAPADAWIERGPNNVGGRTRVVFFDPNDGTNSRVFAGAVSGGLWVTSDITTNGGWTQVAGVPGNLNVSSYTIDPNDSMTWYIGTGEQYTFGQAVGKGVYKTTDGGTTWTAVAIPPSGGGDIVFNPSNLFLSGIFYVNDILAWDNGGTTDLFVAIGAHVYGPSSTPSNWLGLQTAGLYRFDGTGSTWSRIDAGMQYTVGVDTYNRIPNDLEVGSDNTLWMGTVGSAAFGMGGQIYNSTNGTTWTNKYTVTSGNRVELEPSASAAGKIYVLASINSGDPAMYVTTDAFATAPTAITLPSDPDTSVSAGDFTRGQAGYDLVVEADPTDDTTVFIGGINLHRSTNSGGAWTTISHWAAFYSTAGSLVHADQHALTFRPGNSNQAAIGHDGGISFASDLSTTGNSLTDIIPVDDDYNVTQFYHMGVAPTAFNTNTFLGGTQDNGTPYFAGSSTTGPDAMNFDISGGDGAYSFFDQVATDYMLFNYVYNQAITLYDFSQGDYRTVNSNSLSEGDFINPQTLDSNLDILYSHGTVGTTYQIFRYDGLDNLAAMTPAAKTTLSNAILDARVSAMQVSPHTTASTTLLVGLENGSLLKITDADNGSIAWSEFTVPFVGSISDIEYGASEMEIFVTLHNYGVTSIYYSSDGGSSWVSKEGDLPDMPVKCILQNPLNLAEAIVGTELGVWRTANFGDASPNWVTSYNGMSDVKVTHLQLRDDNMVFASTYGRGVYNGLFTSMTLDVEENSIAEDGIKIYPKVSDGHITVKSEQNLGPVVFDVYNLSGQKVFGTEMNLDNSDTAISLNLSSGLYIVKITGETFSVTDRILLK